MDRAKTNSKYMLFKTKWDRKERKKGKTKIYQENANQRKKGEQY